MTLTRQTVFVLFGAVAVIIGIAVFLSFTGSISLSSIRRKSLNTLRDLTSTSTATSVVTTSSDGSIGTIPIGSIVVPSGTIVAFNSAVAPVGWALCDGTLNTPDLRGRFILGAGNGTNLTPRELNQTGGLEKARITSEQMPPHAHGSRTMRWLNAYAGDSGTGARTAMAPTDGDGNWASTVAGKGEAHENMPPFYVLTYIMKI